jgi:hypothetical protein
VKGNLHGASAIEGWDGMRRKTRLAEGVSLARCGAGSGHRKSESE